MVVGAQPGQRVPAQPPLLRVQRNAWDDRRPLFINHQEREDFCSQWSKLGASTKPPPRDRCAVDDADAAYAADDQAAAASPTPRGHRATDDSDETDDADDAAPCRLRALADAAFGLAAVHAAAAALPLSHRHHPTDDADDTDDANDADDAVAAASAAPPPLHNRAAYDAGADDDAAPPTRHRRAADDVAVDEDAADAHAPPKRLRRGGELTEVPYVYNYALGESNTPPTMNDPRVANDIMRRGTVDHSGLKVRRCRAAAAPPPRHRRAAAALPPRRRVI